jgi:hypothetical protein
MATTSAQRLAIAATLFVLGACRTLPPPPPIPLQLLSSQPLLLAADCEASASIVVDFMIDASGSTSNIAVPAAPACLQQALRAWVASFKYVPLPDAKASHIEWLLVKAPRS